MGNIRPKGLRTWIEVDTDAIARNYRLFRSIIPKSTKLLAVVKSNAYGHSHIDFAREMQKLGADYIAVDSILEGLSLRRSGITIPILVLGHTLDERFADAAKHDIAIAVSSLHQLRMLAKNRYPRPLRIHIKVETGLGRQGFTSAEMPSVLGFIKKNLETKRVIVEGLFTHLAQGKDPASPGYTRRQLKSFAVWTDAIHALGVKSLLHSGASGPTLVFPETHMDMVRIGIGMYGLWPDEKTRLALGRTHALAPVLSWRAVISETKRLPRGSAIGYDSTEKLRRDSIVAIVPIGYWHGFPRALSSKGAVLVAGRRAKVLGRVSMDMIAIDVTAIPGAKRGSRVTLIGKDGRAEISAQEIADLMHASVYELVTRINPLIKRMYI